MPRKGWRRAIPRRALKQQWIAYGRISGNLKRAVVAAEDARFIEHEGVDWEALEKAYEQNRKRGPPRPWRLDDLAAAGEEPVPVGASHLPAQGPGTVDHVDGGGPSGISGAFWRSI